MALGDRSKQQPHEAQNQTINKDNETPHPQIGNHIDFQGLDLTQLSKPDALHIIDAITTGSTLDIANLKSLLQTATNLLKTEPNLISLGTKASQKKTKRDWGVRRKSPSAPPRDHQDDIVAVIGDLHGSLDSLTHILQLLNVQNLDENKKQVVVFNGDFVDRGQHSLEVLLTLLILKLAFPKQVYLIRGNHEDTYVASVYGFQDEIRRKYGEGQTSDIWKSIGNIFGALPIALTTNHALVVHGGLPGADFDLPTLEQLPPETRWSLETTVNPQTQHEKLLCNILWSDPTETDSQCLSKNPRGLGILFGSQVAHDFLKRHQLQYLVRGHEVVAKGVRDMNCGSGKSVITVFSAAAYPSDTGSNDGAVLHLHPDGSYTHESYSLRDTSASCEKVKSQTTEQALEKVRTMIGCNRSKLEKAFAQVPQASAGKVTVDQWVQVMSETIEFAGMPWVALQSRLAPAESSFWSSTSLIDVKAFLQSHSFKLHNSTDMEDEETETLAENHEMLLTVFKFLDTDGNGTLSPDEFKTGVNLLNKRLPPGRQLQNPEALFQNLDIDGNGEISFDEFTHGFGMT
uniref:Serine/threonine-protein phosphatase n=1 Tax=Entomoneis paludosa TaxID=265537 RepID=A0A7S3DNW8_9STRA